MSRSDDAGDNCGWEADEALPRGIGNSSCFLGNETKKAVSKLRM